MKRKEEKYNIAEQELKSKLLNANNVIRKNKEDIKHLNEEKDALQTDNQQQTEQYEQLNQVQLIFCNFGLQI